MTDEQHTRIRRLNELATALFALGKVASNAGAAVSEQVKRETNEAKKNEPTSE